MDDDRGSAIGLVNWPPVVAEVVGGQELFRTRGSMARPSVTMLWKWNRALPLLFPLEEATTQEDTGLSKSSGLLLALLGSSTGQFVLVRTAIEVSVLHGLKEPHAILYLFIGMGGKPRPSHRHSIGFFRYCEEHVSAHFLPG
jgi:hypothetical protein